MTKIIPLAALEEACPSLKLPDGRVVEIRQIDGVGMQLAQLARDDASLMWDVAMRCLPGLTADEVRGFTASVVSNIVRIASGTAESVLTTVGESDAPAATGTPAPSSMTPSGT